MIIDGFVHALPDTDPDETQEWLDSLDAVAGARGQVRARFLMTKLLERARELNIGVPASVSTPYVNTIPPEQQPFYPGDDLLEKRIRRFVRWNAAVMVIKANNEDPGIGGHLSSFASSAILYEVGYNHFFRGKEDGQPGDSIYLQGHAAPGAYARAYLAGRLSEEQLDNFRQEIGGNGLSSYPHPRLMPDFWEFPTVSMGIGPINSIYHARFNKYLHNRGLDDTRESRVWCFIGDGEVDEPETLGSISLAAREKLDNLTWVVNCNLQRLDGPVRGNGKIIQELEAIFRGAGWNVIKVIWGSEWDALLAADAEGVLVNKMNSTVDGAYQRFKTESGEYVREHFFGPDPRLRKLVEHMTDDQIWALRRGGLDPHKVYAAYHAATELKGVPTVILAKTIKGWTLGPDVEGRNATHQIKELTNKQLQELRVRLHLEDDIPEAALEGDAEPPYFRPAVDSPEHTYLMERRTALDGPVPQRIVRDRRPITLPGPDTFTEVKAGSGKVEASTTMAFTRLLRTMLRDKEFGERVVPIIPDEARTFGMDSLFREFGIYASEGQKYEPVDADMLLSYTERKDGQILEEGITEAGSMASFTAAGASYATRGVPMVPFFTFYSMFGFQRVGDFIWAAADARVRGFMMAATAGRTTLQGEGLQHQDGHSLVLSSTVPTVRSFDPAFAYEMGVIIEDGIHRMYGENREDLMYYITLYNENYAMPPMPEGSEAGILAGLYKWADAPAAAKATLLFSGSAQGAAREAQAELADKYDVGLELWSATSFNNLRTEALEVDRWNRLHPAESPRQPFVTQALANAPGPILAVTDFMRAVPDQISRFVDNYTSLGTDGFGRSDTRPKLRRFFEIDMPHIVVTVLGQLARAGEIEVSTVVDAIDSYGLDPDTPAPWLI